MDFDISCILSPLHEMSVHILRKNKIKMLSAKFAQRVVKVNTVVFALIF